MIRWLSDQSFELGGVWSRLESGDKGTWIANILSLAAIAIAVVALYREVGSARRQEQSSRRRLVAVASDAAREAIVALEVELKPLSETSDAQEVLRILEQLSRDLEAPEELLRTLAASNLSDADLTLRIMRLRIAISQMRATYAFEAQHKIGSIIAVDRKKRAVLAVERAVELLKRRLQTLQKSS